MEQETDMVTIQVPVGSVIVTSYAEAEVTKANKTKEK